ncbi:MAG: DUF6665 family protein, partial [Phenylobacterium sp.]
AAKMWPMSFLRTPPKPVASAESAHTALRDEIAAEQAAALGAAGRKVESALAALKAHDGEAEARAALVGDAAEAVWGFLVQREVMGLRDRDRVVAEYAIPREVLNRMGAR